MIGPEDEAGGVRQAVLVSPSPNWATNQKIRNTRPDREQEPADEGENPVPGEEDDVGAHDRGDGSGAPTNGMVASGFSPRRPSRPDRRRHT